MTAPVAEQAGDLVGGREPLCMQALFEAGTSGTGRLRPSALAVQVVVASTYGYPYPAVPEGAPPAVPAKADFVGGMARVDIGLDGRSCQTGVAKPAALGRGAQAVYRRWLDLYGGARAPLGGDGTTLFDQYVFTAVSPATGATLASSRIGQGLFADTLQMAGNIGLGRVFWQGTVGGVVRVAPR
ncbi:MAG: hypothetical protein QM742_18115 [Aquabacterium sp.]